MNTATFDCKTITPMFLTGAKGEPELRVPSIKGAMRFWWRAVRGIDDIKRLNKEENEIFGGTGETEGRSKIAIRVMYKDKELKDKRGSQLKDNYNLTWKFNPESRTLEGKDAGIGYLLYSTVFNSPTQYLKDGFPFSVKLSSPDI
ncbi:MAG: type III-B CRISPR module RAMP protein Cmr1, partial [Thermodesulfobacteriota bacterium]